MTKVSPAPVIDTPANAEVNYPLRRRPKHTNLASLWKPPLNTISVLDTLVEGAEVEVANVKGQSPKR